ncbi:hypothetical protein D3C71_2114800 [compost metagenome]
MVKEMPNFTGVSAMPLRMIGLVLLNSTIACLRARYSLEASNSSTTRAMMLSSTS